jgi:hypothetical protein
LNYPYLAGMQPLYARFHPPIRLLPLDAVILGLDNEHDFARAFESVDAVKLAIDEFLAERNE